LTASMSARPAFERCLWPGKISNLEI
jgi:hypothetical protein